MSVQYLPIESAALEQRLSFLTGMLETTWFTESAADRSAALSKACQATVHRDIAAIQLLLGQLPEARQSLKIAGNLYIEAGALHGFALLAFAYGESAWKIRPNQSEAQILVDALVTSGISNSRLSAQHETPRDRRFDAAVMIPRQLIDLLQALSVSRTEPTAGMREHLDRRLKNMTASAASIMGVNLHRYTNLLSKVTSDNFATEEEETLEAMLQRKRMEIQTAQADAYHWRMALRPACLVNFDLIAVFIAGLNSGFAAALHVLVEKYIDSAAVAWSIAEQLREPPPAPHNPLRAGGFKF